MKILAIEREVPGKTQKDFEPFLKAEAKRVWELMQTGMIREVYFRDKESSVVMVLEKRNIQDAKALLKTLPLVKEGLITFEIIALAPYPGLSRLFNE